MEPAFTATAVAASGERHTLTYTRTRTCARTYAPQKVHKRERARARTRANAHALSSHAHALNSLMHHTRTRMMSISLSGRTSGVDRTSRKGCMVTCAGKSRLPSPRYAISTASWTTTTRTKPRKRRKRTSQGKEVSPGNIPSRCFAANQVSCHTKIRPSNQQSINE